MSAGSTSMGGGVCAANSSLLPYMRVSLGVPLGRGQAFLAEAESKVLLSQYVVASQVVSDARFTRPGTDIASGHFYRHSSDSCVTNCSAAL